MKKLFVVATALAIGALSLTSVDAFPKGKGKGKGKGRVSVDERFKKMDKNSDGKVSKDEFLADKKGKRLEAAEKRFALIDADKDGNITLEELKKAPRPMRKKKS